MSKSVRYHSATQISYETRYIHDSDSGNEHAVPLSLRMFFPQEIDALLHYNGFVIEHKYADYEEHPFDDSSHRQVILCTASERS